MAEFQVELKMAAASVEALLDSVLSGAARAGEPAWPDRLTAALRYAVLGPGKRLRPFLLMESARIFGHEGDGPLRAGAALECIHCYSLVHDDLPAMDDDDMRRGRPTVHVQFDEATAILVGDVLQPLAFGILADPATDPDARIRTALIAGLATAAGAGGMVGGQALDLAAEKRRFEEHEVREMQALKTGALFRYACEAGAILGRASAEKRERLAKFGAQLGLVFQLADDLIDVTGSASVAGKAIAKDAGRGKATLVGIHGVDGARKLLDEAVAEAVMLIAPFGPQGKVLADAARFAGKREV
ncbi:MAG TPA: farnesyl diphosphate synthase [Bauldia sp.]|nr:farnesyl diphosphate synthase [Bauldia sp.]